MRNSLGTCNGLATGDSTICHMDYNNILQVLGDVDPKRDNLSDNLYKNERAEQRAFVRQAPWRRDPEYFKYVKISSLALVRMSEHAKSGGANEVMGVMTGKVVENAFIVLDAYPLPVEATETRVNAMGEAYEYMVQYLESLQDTDRAENLVGWYHSHPSYGCWLSRIDVGTQRQNQVFQDPFLAIVIDPNRTLANGKVDIGAFRTLPEDFNNANQRDEPRTSEHVDSEYGLYHKEYYPLEISYFRTSLDEPLFDLVWNRYWTSLLADNRLAIDRDYSLGKIKESVDLIVRRQRHICRATAPFKNSTAQTKEILESLNGQVRNDAGSLVALKVRNRIFMK